MTIDFRPDMTMADLPIPKDVKPAPDWPPLILDFAAHIGPFDALRIADALGGRVVRITIDAERSVLRPFISQRKNMIMSDVYGGERFVIPKARSAIDRARRAPLLAAARNGDITKAAVQRITGASYPTVHRWIRNGEAIGTAPVRTQTNDHRQIDMFPDL